MQNLDRFKTKVIFEDGRVIIMDNTWGTRIEMGEKIKIAQPTGFKDKNGELIFEGDLIKWFPVNVVYKIEWQQHLGGFCAASKDNLILDYQMSAACEVIGNIYENQDLAKEHDLI